MVKTFESLTDVGDDLETVANTNVPPGRLAFRREVLGEERRLMMLSTRRSRSNTAESWFDTPETDESSTWNLTQNGVTQVTPARILGMIQGFNDGMEDLEERNERECWTERN